MIFKNLKIYKYVGKGLNIGYFFWLIKNFCMQNIPYIDYLNALPLDCLILEMLPVHAIYKHSMNGTSSRASSQETETDKIPVVSEMSWGLEQGGTTGTIFLAKAI